MHDQLRINKMQYQCQACGVVYGLKVTHDDCQGGVFVQDPDGTRVWVRWDCLREGCNG